jgi:hypothetical protein
VKRRNRWMIVITGLTGNLSGKHSGRAGLKEGADVAVWKWSSPNGVSPFLPYAVLAMSVIGVTFLPCKNCNIEIRSHNYTTVDEAVFSPCWAELSCERVLHRVALPRLVCCQATAINTWMMQE